MSTLFSMASAITSVAERYRFPPRIRESKREVFDKLIGGTLRGLYGWVSQFRKPPAAGSIRTTLCAVAGPHKKVIASARMQDQRGSPALRRKTVMPSGLARPRKASQAVRELLNGSVQEFARAASVF